MNNKTLFSVILLSAIFSTHFAQANKNEINFNFSADAEYDSSVGITELDDYTREGDSAWIVKGGLKGRWQQNETFSLRSHYELTSRNYATQNAYDQLQHHISLNPQFAFSKVKVGFRHDTLLIDLAGEKFMNYQLNSLAIEGAISPAFYLRVAYNFADKKLHDFSERSADIQDWTGDLFWFSKSGKHLIVLSTKTGEENARVDQYDFDSTQWKLGYAYKFKMGDHPTKIKLTQTQNKRRYSFVDDNNPQARADNKQTSEVSLETELHPKFLLTAGIKFANNNSNVASVAYKEEITAVGVHLKF